MATPTFTLTAGEGLHSLISEERTALKGAVLTFKCNLTPGELLALDGGLDIVDTVRVTLDADGKINGDSGVQLLADDPSLNLEHPLQWRVEVSNAKARGLPKSVTSWSFEAANDGDTVALDSLAHIPGQSATGSVRVFGPILANDVTDSGAAGRDVLRSDSQTELRESVDVDTYAVYLANRDGLTDDRAVLAAADTAAQVSGKPLLLLPGEHLVSSDLTITSPIDNREGGVLKPANGVTVVVAGGVLNNDGNRQIFDQSLGGLCIPKNVPGLHPAWWGPVVTDVDDTATWNDMVTACESDTVDQPYKQRIFVPAGPNRMFEIDFRNFHLEGYGRSARILPPATATPGDPTGSDTGYVVKLQSTTTVDGVDFEDGGIDGITVVFWNGSKVTMVNGRVVLSGATTTGILTWVATGGLTPKLTDMSIQGVLGSDAADSATGLDIRTTDGEVVNCTIHDLGVGIKLSSTSWVFDTTHVYQCQTGIRGFGYDTRFIGCQIADCFGWGIDFYQGCTHCTWDSGTKIWRNGITVADTGGMHLKQPDGGGCTTNRIDARFDDNHGTSLYLEKADRTTGDLRIVSTLATQGGSPVGTDGVYIDSLCTNTELRVRTGVGPVVTGRVVNNQSGEKATIDYPSPVATTTQGDTGTENGANTWAKLASFTNTTQLRDLNAVYAFTTNYAATGENGILSVRLRNNGTGVDPTADVQVLCMGGFTSSTPKLSPQSFKLIYGALGDPFELWVQKSADYLDVKLRELVASDKSGWTVSYSQSAAWQSATPTGTVGNKASTLAVPPESSTTTATSAGTLTMDITSTPVQTLTGSTTHTVKLPTTSVLADRQYTIINQSTGTVTVQSSSGATICNVAGGRLARFVSKVNTPTAATDWGAFVGGSSSSFAPLTAALRDDNSNLFSSNFIAGRTSTAASADILAMSSGSSKIQLITGATTHTVKLPTTSVLAGTEYMIISQSTGDITVQSSDGSTKGTLSGGSSSIPVAKTYQALKDTPTTVDHWREI